MIEVDVTEHFVSLLLRAQTRFTLVVLRLTSVLYLGLCNDVSLCTLSTPVWCLACQVQSSSVWGKWEEVYREILTVSRHCIVLVISFIDTTGTQVFFALLDARAITSSILSIWSANVENDSDLLGFYLVRLDTASHGYHKHCKCNYGDFC